jgi:hypothetical protein
MIVSLNEIEAIVYKAVRGAGYAWGLAEDAARAARCLAAADQPWSPSLLRLLNDDRIASPVLDGDTLSPPTGGTRLSPLIAGPAACDLLTPGVAIRVQDAAEPVWVLAAASARASASEHVRVTWNGGEVIVAPTGFAGPIARVADSRRATLTLTLVPAVAIPAFPPNATDGVFVDDGDLAALAAFEARTYVPESERSRLAGAGAGLSDND